MTTPGSARDAAQRGVLAAGTAGPPSVRRAAGVADPPALAIDDSFIRHPSSVIRPGMADPPGLAIDDPSYFDRLAEIEAGHWWALGLWRLAAHWLNRALAGRRGLVALDVGCGAGVTAGRLADRAEIASLVGIDPSPAAIDHARRRGVPVARATALQLPFGDGAFDLVTCLDVLQHVGPGADRLALGEIARVLRPGGIALIRSNGRGWSGGQGGDGGERPYRLGALVARAEAAGMVVERATYANCLPSLAQELVGRLVWPVRGRGSMLPHPSGGGLRIRMPSPARHRLMGTIVGIEALLAGRLGVALPFGHSTMVLGRRLKAEARGQRPETRGQ